MHHIGLVVDALVLSALQRWSDTNGRLLDARRTYETIGGSPSSKNSFRGNVHQAVPLMRDVFRRRLEAIRAASRDVELRGRLQTFSDVIIPDGCAFKIAAALSNLYPGTSQSAELKLHAVYCVRAGGCSSVTMARESRARQRRLLAHVVGEECALSLGPRLREQRAIHRRGPERRARRPASQGHDEPRRAGVLRSWGTRRELLDRGRPADPFAGRLRLRSRPQATRARPRR